MKRLLSRIVTLLLATALLPTAAWAAVNPPPEVYNVTVYASLVPPSGSVTVGADIVDNDGIEMNSFWFEHNNGYRLMLSLSYTAGYGTAAERYSGKLNIPADAPEGVYTLVFVSATDKAYNRTRLYPPDDPRSGGSNAYWLGSQPTFEVRSGVPDPDKTTTERKSYHDSTPPVFGSVRLGFAERFSRGTRHELFVEATDVLGGTDTETSGIGHVTLRFRNDRNGRIVSKVLSANDRAGKVYHGWLEVNSYEPSGTFTLYQVTAVDRAFNTITYCRPVDLGDSKAKKALTTMPSFVLDNGSVTVDTTAPTLQAVTTAKGSIEAGETLYVTATASDNLSGVQSVSLQFRSDVGKTITVLLADRGDTMGGTIQGYQTAKAGSYKLTRATVTDQAGNRSSSYAQASGNLVELTISSGFVIVERSK